MASMGLRGVSRFAVGWLIAVGVGGLLPAAAGAVTYSTPGRYKLVVPSGVSKMVVIATGGQGGDAVGYAYPCGYPGRGGLEKATFPVKEGTTLDITVAGRGANGTGASGTNPGGAGAGGIGGGGDGGNAVAGPDYGQPGSGGGGGGGASSVSVGSDPLLVAAGGGGCAAPSADSSTGGGNDGAAGGGGDETGGGPGTLTAGGAGGAANTNCWGGVPGTNGTQGQGGSGGGGANVDSAGGGGGGGYYGGGGGAGGLWASCASEPLSGSGGGGGSDYVASTGSKVTSKPGSNAGNGKVTVNFYAQISGKITAGCTASSCSVHNLPVAGLKIAISGSNASVDTTTGVDGTYTADVPKGAYKVVPTGHDFTMTPTDKSINVTHNLSGVNFEACSAHSSPKSATDLAARVGTAAELATAASQSWVLNGSGIECSARTNIAVAYNTGTHRMAWAWWVSALICPNGGAPFAADNTPRWAAGNQSGGVLIPPNQVKSTSNGGVRATYLDNQGDVEARIAIKPGGKHGTIMLEKSPINELVFEDGGKQYPDCHASLGTLDLTG